MNEDAYMKNRHACYKLEYHLVVVTKYRNPVLVGEVKEDLFAITRDLLTNSWGCSVRNVNAEADHVHVLFSAPPQVRLSDLVNNYKTVTSRLLRKKHQAFLSKYYWKPLFWSDSYFVGAVSDVNEEIVSLYIDSQGKRNGR